MKNLLELNIMWKKSCLILFLGLAGSGSDAPVAQKLETRMSIPSELIGEQTAFKASPKNSQFGEKINTFVPEDAVILEKMFHNFTTNNKLILTIHCRIILVKYRIKDRHLIPFSFEVIG